MKMSTTALLSTIYDFGIDHSKRSVFRNSSSSNTTNSNSHHQNHITNQYQTNNSIQFVASTGDINCKSTTVVATKTANLHLPSTGYSNNNNNINTKSERMTGLFYHYNHHQGQQQAHHHHHHTNTNLHQAASSASPGPSTILQSQQLQLPYAKMSGGIRRTVSSASAQTNSSTTTASTNNLTGSGRGNNNNNNNNNNNHHHHHHHNGTTNNTAINNSSSKVNTQSSINNNKNSIAGHHKSSSAASSSSSSSSSSDSHKKLDRSFSEPAEKKQSQQQGANGNSAGGSSLQTPSRYKTELCRSFAEVGHCKYGDKCQFAHGDEELRTITRHPKFKTENCKSFHSTGFCPYGPRCHFIHNSEESKKSMLNLPVSTNLRLFETNPLPITNIVGGGHQSLVASQSTGPSLPLIQNHLPFGSTNTNLVRPKALSLGSYSLGSSGEISSPSSQSGSPTSLNSFFSEETAFAINNGFVAPNSRMSTNFPVANSNTFSFSPDSAFVAFNPNNQNNNCNGTSNNNIIFNNGNSCHSQKTSIFAGSTGINSNFSSPEPTIADQTTNSVISQLFGPSSGSPTFEPVSFNEMMIPSSLVNGNKSSMVGGGQQMIFYPTSPDSPVDSVASEIEALKLGEQPALTSINFSPISSSFSTSSMSTASSASPPNSNISSGSSSSNSNHQIDLDAFTFLPTANLQSSVPNCVGGTSISHQRLPTFTKIATNSQNISHPMIINPIGSSSPNQSIESLD